MKHFLGSVTATALTLAASAASAGSTLPPVRVDEPGLMGLAAGAIVAVIAVAKFRRK